MFISGWRSRKTWFHVTICQVSWMDLYHTGCVINTALITSDKPSHKLNVNMLQLCAELASQTHSWRLTVEIPAGQFVAASCGDWEADEARQACEEWAQRSSAGMQCCHGHIYLLESHTAGRPSITITVWLKAFDTSVYFVSCPVSNVLFIRYSKLVLFALNSLKKS